MVLPVLPLKQTWYACRMVPGACTATAMREFVRPLQAQGCDWATPRLGGASELLASAYEDSVMAMPVSLAKSARRLGERTHAFRVRHHRRGAGSSDTRGGGLLLAPRSTVLVSRTEAFNDSNDGWR